MRMLDTWSAIVHGLMGHAARIYANIDRQPDRTAATWSNNGSNNAAGRLNLMQARKEMRNSSAPIVRRVAAELTRWHRSTIYSVVGK